LFFEQKSKQLHVRFKYIEKGVFYVGFMQGVYGEKMGIWGDCKHVSRMCQGCCKHAANMLELGMNEGSRVDQWGMALGIRQEGLGNLLGS
jgi:hypothetical protein